MSTQDDPSTEELLERALKFAEEYGFHKTHFELADLQSAFVAANELIRSIRVAAAKIERTQINIAIQLKRSEDPQFESRLASGLSLCHPMRSKQAGGTIGTPMSPPPGEEPPEPARGD